VREVYAAIEHLTPNQRCVIDGYANEWTTQEIADALGFSHRGVRKMLCAGKRTLRERLGVRA
jgi:DNA-directed RNA polymerase specialized sigma24 family protein